MTARREFDSADRRRVTEALAVGIGLPSATAGCTGLCARIARAMGLFVAWILLAGCGGPGTGAGFVERVWTTNLADFWLKDKMDNSWVLGLLSEHRQARACCVFISEYQRPSAVEICGTFGFGGFGR